MIARHADEERDGDDGDGIRGLLRDAARELA
jgi:hypothetical protein